MSIHRIPINKLSHKALRDVIEEFITDDETETTNIFLADDPILKKLDAMSEQSRRNNACLSIKFIGSPDAEQSTDCAAYQRSGK